MRKVISWSTQLLFLMISLLITGNLGVGGERKNNKGDSGRGLAKIVGIDRPRWIPNRIADYITNNGQLVSQIPRGNSAGMEWPVGSNNFINYASGVWVAGIKEVGGIKKIVCATGEFAVEFQPGPIVGYAPGVPGTASNDDDPRYKVYIINDSDLENPTANPDYVNWPVEDGAPVIRNADGTTRPGLIGYSTTWSVFNDLDANLHARRLGSNPMGIEVQQTTWAFNRPDAFGDMLFFKFTIINKSGVNIDSTFISLWADIDIGGALNLVGCDTSLSLGYMYMTQSDPQYGSSPPAIGYDFFQGPIVSSPGDTALVSGKRVPGFRNLPMTSFAKYINGGPPQFADPGTAGEAYSFMNGFDRTGAPVINELTLQPTKFWHTGDPATGTGWLDPLHDDKRFLMNSGPFTLADGDTQEVVAGMVIAQGPDVASTIRLLRQNDQSAQAAYDNNFILPSLPPAPLVEVVPDSASLLLKWDDRSEAYNEVDNFHVNEDGSPSFYTFQGYNVYQLDELNPGTSTTIKKIATFDVIDGITAIRDDVDDPETGDRINKVVQSGNDGGVARYLRITTDDIRGKIPLIPNRRYYYAVTAFGYNPIGVPKVLESNTRTLLSIPQSQPLGNRLTSAFGTALSVQHNGTSDGSVSPVVVDPARLTGNDYEVRFRSTENGSVWDVWNVSTNSKVASDQTHQGGDGDFNYPLLDGLLVKVVGPPSHAKDWDFSLGAGRDERWITGVNWAAHGDVLFGGIDFIGADGPSALFGRTSSLLAGQMKTIEFRFSGTATQKAYRYLRNAQAAAADPSFAPFIVNTSATYAYQDVRDVPFTVWEVDAADGDPNPKQLTAGFLENNVAPAGGAGLVDGQWAPTAHAEGGREILWIFPDAYDATMSQAKYQDNVLNNTWFDAMYVVWALQRRPPNPVWGEGDVLTVLANHVNSEADVFSFKSAAPVKNNAALAKQQINLVNVWPNPYAGLNVEERDPVNRFVTFTHLTPTAKIRIFTITGELVQVIEHSDQSQFERWDLRNTDGVPVASGIYIAHVELPSLGQRILKIAVFQPEERLDVF